MTTKISTDQLLAMLASELDAAKVQLEQLGLALTLNPATAAAHVRELQALDHCSQRCASVAAILRAEDMAAATHAASLESIVDRVRNAADNDDEDFDDGDFVTFALPEDEGEVEWYS